MKYGASCEGKINHLGLKDFPKRSTLSDANKRRDAQVFADIYGVLYKRYCRFLSDSRTREPAVKDLKIVDSSTITLFSDILRGVGRNSLNGKKGSDQDAHDDQCDGRCPCLVKFSNAYWENDQEFQLRRIVFWHEEKRKAYEFITNNYE